MSIILSGVSYRYRNQQFLFEGIDLSVAAGAKAAVVSSLMLILSMIFRNSQQ